MSNMDINKRITKLLGFLPANEWHEARVCIETLEAYCVLVVEEQLQLKILETIKNEEGNSNYFANLKQWEKWRSEAHDAAINACSRLNELCSEVNVDKICDFDISDRRKVAEFCGFVVSELFYSNINCKDPVASWISFANRTGADEEG